MMTQSLELYVKRSSRFDLSDIFGQGRIRKLIYEYEELRKSSAKKLADCRSVMTAQAMVVTQVLSENIALKKDNSYLKQYIQLSDEAKANLQKRKMDAEENRDSIFEENQRLKDELKKVKLDLDARTQELLELTEVHEKFINDLCNGQSTSI